jgi:putative transposase
MDGQVKSRNDADTYCKILADHPEFSWARLLNSQPRQAHAEKAWASIKRFSQKCRSQVKGKKGFPQFKKHPVRASVEYKVSERKLSEDRRYLEFTNGIKAVYF